jgi:hypothetical protein
MSFDPIKFNEIFEKAMSNERLSKKEREYFNNELKGNDIQSIFLSDDENKYDYFFRKKDNLDKLSFIDNYLQDYGYQLSKIKYYSKLWTNKKSLHEMHDTYHQRYFNSTEIDHNSAFRDFKDNLIKLYFEESGVNTGNYQHFTNEAMIPINEISKDIIINELIGSSELNWEGIEQKYYSLAENTPYLNEAYLVQIFDCMRNLIMLSGHDLSEEQEILINAYQTVFATIDSKLKNKTVNDELPYKISEFGLRLYFMGDKFSHPLYYTNYLLSGISAKPSLNYSKNETKKEFEILSIKLFEIYRDNRNNNGKIGRPSDGEKKFFLYILNLIQQKCNIFSNYTFSLDSPTQSWLNWKDFRNTSNKRIKKLK